MHVPGKVRAALRALSKWWAMFSILAIDLYLKRFRKIDTKKRPIPCQVRFYAIRGGHMYCSSFSATTIQGVSL